MSNKPDITLKTNNKTVSYPQDGNFVFSLLVQLEKKGFE